jgi:Domain of unknown function (DUF4118)
MDFRKLKVAIAAHYEGFVLAVALAGIFAIAFLVQNRISFLNFFFLPVILAGYYLGKRKGVLLAVLCVLLVVLFFVFQEKVFGNGSRLSFEDLISIVTWGGFLILTGGLLGAVAEQRENKLRSMKRAYIGVLSVLLRYLEVADAKETRPIRVARLAGAMAERAGLSMRDIENIKSAALLCDAGELGSSLPLFEDVVGFMELDGKASSGLSDRERVLLKTTASLLKEIGPLLEGYFRYYVKEADTADKDLDAVPFGSSLIALAGICDGIKVQGTAHIGPMEIRSLRELDALKDRAFSARALRTLPEGTD